MSASTPRESFRPTARPLMPAEGSAAPSPATGAAPSAAPDTSEARPPGRSDFRCTCPNCGSELWDKECKSRCPRCHFFTDCSDPW